MNQRRFRKRAPFQIVDISVVAGRQAKLELPIARLMSGTPVALPVIVVHGRQEGPTIWVSAAVHGDEICGVEIIRRVLKQVDPKALSGTILAVPVVNVHGFNTGSRYLPDRRDLNRSFPGSQTGSLASRLAHLMMKEVIGRSDIGIDLHTGSDQRINLPQVRGDMDNPSVRSLATTFGAPISLHAKTRDGSLRAAATDSGATVLLFEGGEAGRFDQLAIAAGVNGVLRAMAAYGMTDEAPIAARDTRFSSSSKWTRATRSGIAHIEVNLGQDVSAGDLLATVHDPFGKRLGEIKSKMNGVVIGHTQTPLVNRGDAIIHLAQVEPEPEPESESAPEPVSG